MTLPHREWTATIVRTLAQNSDNLVGPGYGSTIDKWTDDHIEEGIAGGGNDGASPKYWYWYPIIIGINDFELVSSANEIIDVGIDIELNLTDNSAGVGSFKLYGEVIEDLSAPKQWDVDKVTGKYYDGTNPWDYYAPWHAGYASDYLDINVATDFPYSTTIWWPAYYGGYAVSNIEQEYIFRLGLAFSIWYYDISYPFGNGEFFKCSFQATKITVNYFNPVVNSLSKIRFSENGGDELILTGLGFDQSDAELNSTARCSKNQNKLWNSFVTKIIFEGQEGQGDYELTLVGGDFSIDSDTKITIPSMPAIKSGTYRIKLVKGGVAEVGEVESYAGEFFADETGKMSPGVDNAYGMFTIIVGEAESKAPYFTWEWAWKIAGELVWKYYAPIDMRATDRFYEGRILSAASATRSIDDFTGMFQVSDLDVELASNDSEFQKLLAQGYCKNQPVKLYFGWTDEPHGWKERYFQGIVDDYILSGPTFKATLKDITQKYLRKKLPLYIVTTEEWPNAHENAIGKAIPEVLGLHSLTTGENLGAIEALCIDTTSNKYIAAVHPLNSVIQVYADNVLVNPANYTVSNDAEGRAFITFSSSQGDKKITYNAEGYSLAAWNSSNGYIQNPAYVLGFFLVYLAEVPIDYIDIDSLDEVADLFEDNGWDECGKLALTELEDASSVLQKLLFSFGIKAWPDREGKLHFGRKDLTTFDTDKTIIAQTDCIEAPTIEFNLRDAVNRIKVCWDYYPAASVYGGAREFESDASITDFESEIENYETWEYPCVSCEDFAVLRAGEDLQRLSYGNRVVSFTLPIDFIDELEIFDTFILQDTFGLSPTGQGEEQHYYYVTSLTYDFQNMTIGVKASDLQWLAGQCFIIGRCSELEHNYADASQWMKVFGYIGSCDDESLPGGDPLKKICKCQ
ncbi:MAG: hypothetical protein ACTSYJ_00580 [Candidatus Thorarchaeota archaeon]